MAHEIKQFDGVVFHRVPAWHGLGIVVEDAPTPLEALQIAGLDYEVESWPMSATGLLCGPDGVPGSATLDCSDWLMNVRTDTTPPTQLGIVSSNWQVIQNRQHAEFCELLAEQGDVVKVESAGSIRNGSKVWFLLKGESFSVLGKENDEILPYILVSNGFDGKTGFRCTPTTVRVVCANTLHMVIGDGVGDSRILQPAGYSCNHVGDVLGKIEDAKQALSLYGRSLDATRQLIDETAAKEMTREDVQQFFLECYTRDFGSFTANPQNRKEERALNRSQDAFLAFSERFDSERAIAGTTAWNAFNSYTGWSQHRSYYKDSTKELERSVSSKLFGTDTDRATKTLSLALSI
jgi:phage/plasmid-like protein (TIGR03299 family)